MLKGEILFYLPVICNLYEYGNSHTNKISKHCPLKRKFVPSLRAGSRSLIELIFTSHVKRQVNFS